MIVSDQQWNRSGTFCEMETVRINLQPTEQQIFSLGLAALSIKSSVDENLGYSKKNSVAQKRFVCVTKQIAVMTNNLINSNLVAKTWIKERLKTVVSKYSKVFEQVMNVTSTNRGFRTLQHAVATNEQTKKGVSYFYSRRNVQQYGIHLVPLIKNYGLFNIKYLYLWVTYNNNAFVVCCHL